MFRVSLTDDELQLVSDDIKVKSVKGGLYSFLGQITTFVLTMGSTVILARLLTPEDYGLVGIVTAFFIFFMLFNDFGFSLSIIQKKDIHYEEVATIAWLNIILSAIFSLIMFLSSWMIADFYDDQRLVSIAQVVALVFIFGGVSSIHKAILSRQMKFKQITAVNILSTAFAITLSIYMAVNDFGYCAIVASMLSLALFKSISLIIILDWFPRPTLSVYWLKQHFKFGKNITIFNFINYFTRNLDTLLIGKFYNPTLLGLYNKAYQLLLLPVQQLRGPIYSVGLPALASLRSDPIEYEKYFMKLVMILTFLSALLVPWMWLNSYEIVMIVLGEQWITSAFLFKTLAISALIQPVEGLLGLLLISMSLSKKYVQYGFIYFIIMCTSFIIGIQYDINTFVMVYVIANYISFILASLFVLPSSPISTLNFFKVIMHSSIFFFGGAILINWIVQNTFDGTVELLILKTLLYACLILIFLVVFPKYKKLLLDVRRIIKK